MRTSVIVLMIALSISPAFSKDKPVQISVQQEYAELPASVPVVIPCPNLEPLSSGESYTLKPQKSGLRLRAQYLPGIDEKTPPALAFLLPSGLPKESSYYLTIKPDPVFSLFRLEDNGTNRLAVYDRDRLVLEYIYETQQPPAGIPADRARSCYISPILGLDGEQITDDFPDDHHHHRGLFWAWPGFKVDGETHDHYHIDGAWTRYEKWLGNWVGRHCAQIRVQNGWYLKDRKVGTEVMVITVWRSDDIAQAIDLEMTWTSLEPVTVQGRPGVGYGGFNLRLADRLDPVMMFPEGPQERSDMRRSPWADMSARFDNRAQVSGIGVFVHPDNEGFPPGWTIRPKPDYGFIGASWPGLIPFTFEPGQPVTVRHRIWLHRGNVDEGKVREAYELYQKPPTIKGL